MLKGIEKDCEWLGTLESFHNFQDIILGFRLPPTTETENPLATAVERWWMLHNKLTELYSEVLDNLVRVLGDTDELFKGIDALVQSQLANADAVFDESETWGHYRLEAFANIVRLLNMSWQYYEFGVIYFVPYPIPHKGALVRNDDGKQIIGFMSDLVWGEYQIDYSIDKPVYLMGYYELVFYSESGSIAGVNTRGYITIAADCRAADYDSALIDCINALPESVTLRIYSFNINNIVTNDYTDAVVGRAWERKSK